jgi:hypothetical protein
MVAENHSTVVWDGDQRKNQFLTYTQKEEVFVEYLDLE